MIGISCGFFITPSLIMKGGQRVRELSKTISYLYVFKILKYYPS